MPEFPNNDKIESSFSIRLNGDDLQPDAIDQLDHKAAVRGLKYLRAVIGWERMMEILKPEIEASSERWVGWHQAAGGKLTAQATYFEVSGISAEYFVPWMMNKIPDQDFQFYMHPEHFIWKHVDVAAQGYNAGDNVVVEPWGSIMWAGKLEFCDWRSFDTCGEADDSFPIKLAGVARYPDGSVKKSSFYQLRSTETGFIMKAAGGNPFGLPEEVLDGMNEHLVLEWSNAFRRARAESEVTR